MLSAVSHEVTNDCFARVLLGKIHRSEYRLTVLIAEGGMGLATQPRSHMITMVTARILCTPPAQHLLKSGYLTMVRQWMPASELSIT